jgi:PKD repeat protein
MLSATIATGSNVTYTWALGDGTFEGGAVVSHTYPAVGTYTAIVTTANSIGEVAAMTMVTITDVPIAGLRATNDSPTLLGNLTTLTVTVTAGSNVTFTWAFGDGTMGSGEVVTCTYPAEGIYTAVVTAANSGSEVTATTVITITRSHFFLHFHALGPKPSPLGE